jgi:hypothetical protein
VDYIVNEARAALAAYGLSKSIWINETNASPDADPQWPLERPRWRVDLREQASFILQAYALGLAAGAERIGVYKLIDAGLPPGGEPFGLLRPDHSRRPAYVAYQLATSYYAGTGAARIIRQPLMTQVTLDRGERTTRVFWARTTAQVAVTVPALAAQAVLIDQEGNTQPLDGSSGSYALTLPGARCADETLGCIIGGPTYLLVEEAPAGETGAPDAQAATPTARVFEEEVTPTAEVTGTLSVTTTLPPPSPTITPTASPTDIPTPSPTPSPTLTPPPTATATPSPTPSATPSATPTSTTTPSPTPTPSPTSTPAPQLLGVPIRSTGLLALGGLVIALGAGLAGVVLWRVRGGADADFRG